MLHKLEILTVIGTTSHKEVLEKALKFLPGKHVETSLSALLCEEDGVVICLLRSTERSGMIFAKAILRNLWRLSFNSTDSKVSVSQMMYGMHDISKINNWEEVIKGMNCEDLFD